MKLFILRSGLIDKYYVNENEIIKEFLNIRNDSSRSIHFLDEILEKGVEEVSVIVTRRRGMMQRYLIKHADRKI